MDIEITERKEDLVSAPDGARDLVHYGIMGRIAGTHDAIHFTMQIPREPEATIEQRGRERAKEIAELFFARLLGR